MNYLARLSALQTEREMICQFEKKAYLNFLEESGLDKDEEPPTGLSAVFKEIMQGVKAKKTEPVLEV